MMDQYIQNGETLSEPSWDFAPASGSKLRGKNLRPSMTPVFAGLVREGASDVLPRGLDASEVNRFQDRRNSLSSNGCEGTIAATPLEILPMVRMVHDIVMSSSC